MSRRPYAILAATVVVPLLALGGVFTSPARPIGVTTGAAASVGVTDAGARPNEPAAEAREQAASTERARAAGPVAETGTQIIGTQITAHERTVINFGELARTARRAPAVAPAPRAPRAELQIPGDLPVPFAALPQRIPTAATTVTPQSGASSPPTVGTSFKALDDNISYIPPDTNGAVGPNHVMTTLNSQVLIQSRTGTTSWGPVSLGGSGGFWNGSTTTDPKVLYDPYNARWMFTTAAYPAAANSAVLMAVSATNDPTGSWYRYSFDADGPGTIWCDYPSMGHNTTWIVVTCNMFTNAGSFSNTRIFVFSKAALYAGDVSPSATVINVSASNGATIAPAATYDATQTTEYLLQRWNGNSGGAGYIRSSTITGSVGSETLTVGPLMGTPNPWSNTGNGAPQQGSVNGIDAGDDRMQNVVYRNGSIWGTHTVFLSGRAVVQWWQVTPGGSITQFGRVSDASTYYYSPSIAVNNADDALIGFTQSSSAQYASAAFAFRQASDAANTLQTPTLLKAGEAPYFKTYGGTRNRWGDYSNTVVDPVNDSDMWTIQEFATTAQLPYDRWSTWWGKIVPPSSLPAPIASLSPSSLSFASRQVGTTSPAQTETVSNTGNASLTISGISIAGANPGDFSQSGSCNGATVAAGSSCTIQVTFSPSSSGARAASLSIASNAGGSPHAVSLSGTGTAVPSSLSISPASNAYGNQTLGTTSAPRTFTVANTGGATVTIGSLSIAGSNPGDFVRSADTCTNASLPPSATCTVNVAFAPSAAGARAGTLAVPSNATGSPNTASLNGTGVGIPAASITPANLPFGNQALSTSSPSRSVTVTNSGTGTLTISAVGFSGPNPGDFTKSSDTCNAAALAPSASCSFTVAFAPSALGARAASATVSSNAASSPDLVSLAGTGINGQATASVTPASITYAPLKVGATSAAQMATLSNTGTAAMTVSGVTITGPNGGEFDQTNTCSAAINPGQSCVVTVRFTPGAAGARSATLSLTDDAPSSPQTVALSGAGDDAPPVSHFATASGAVLLGGFQTIQGYTTDDFSGVDGLTLKLTPLFGSATTGRPTQVGCDSSHAYCGWASTVPLTPGMYVASITSTDYAGNAETAGPTITIIVL